MTYTLKTKPTKKEQWALSGANAKIVKETAQRLVLKHGHKPSNDGDDYEMTTVETGNFIITSTHRGTAFKNGVKDYTRNVVVKAYKIEEVK